MDECHTFLSPTTYRHLIIMVLHAPIDMLPVNAFFSIKQSPTESVLHLTLKFSREQGSAASEHFSQPTQLQ